jgi:hypothetical protein
MRTAKVRTKKSLHSFETHRSKRVRFSCVVCFLCLLSSCGCIIAILAGFLLATIPVLVIGFALEEVAAISFVVVYLLAPGQPSQIGHLTKQGRAELRAALGASD